MNKTKFERNSSLEFYHKTCIEKTKTQAKESVDKDLPYS